MLRRDDGINFARICIPAFTKTRMFQANYFSWRDLIRLQFTHGGAGQGPAFLPETFRQFRGPKLLKKWIRKMLSDSIDIGQVSLNFITSFRIYFSY